MTPQTHALALLVEDRIEQLTNYRRWFRASPIMRRAIPSVNAEYKAELHALLRLRWRARKIARDAQVAQSTAVDAGVAEWMAR